MNKEFLAIFGGEPVRKTQWQWKTTIGEEELAAVQEVMKSGRLSVFRGGKYVQEFENKFSHYSGAKFGVATTSGTTALHAAVAAIDIKQNDEVLVPPLTFVSTASVVLQQNALPVFVDIDPRTYCMDVSDLERKITDRTKAIMPVHIFGHPANMSEIQRLASKYKLHVIADAAQAHGARINDQPIGTYGDMNCYSFFQTKNMTTGEGGMVLTNNEDLLLKLRLRREHGSPRNAKTWYIYDELGFNYSMTEMQAAIGMAQLAKLTKMNDQRRANSAQYLRELSNTKLILPSEEPGYHNVYHNFPVLLPLGKESIRQEFVEAIRAENVPADICYPIPLYKTALFEKNGIKANCRVAESFCERVVTLFTDPVLDNSDIATISRAVSKVAEHYLK